ncbi:MAG: hypothetical protein RM347_004355 [Nostoc sp. ChiQUE02]|nr:hypothetical protein [Nostoc sp. ChiQUE02]
MTSFDFAQLSTAQLVERTCTERLVPTSEAEVSRSSRNQRLW